MKLALQHLGRRIDALSLRERVFLFLSAAAVVVAVADALVISPALAQQRGTAQQLARHNAELVQLRSQLAAATTTPQADSPNGRLQAALRAAQEEHQRLLTQLQAPATRPGGGTDTTASPVRLADLLARVLRRHERLSLVRLVVAGPAAAPSGTHSATHSATPVATPTPTAPGAIAPAAGLQEVDLVLSGSYLALAAYLAEIEAALPGLRWGPMKLEGGDRGAQLTLRLWITDEAR